MTQFINLYSVKGGQGTSTTVALLAKHYATAGNKTVLIVDREDGDLPALLGVATPDVGTTVPVTSGVDLLLTDNDIQSLNPRHDVVICDLGRSHPRCENILVTLPDYVSLRRAVANADIRHDAKSVIIVRPAGRVLSDNDIQAVLGLPIHKTIEMSEDVARASDAGLLMKTTRNLLQPV